MLKFFFPRLLRLVHLWGVLQFWIFVTQVVSTVCQSPIHEMIHFFHCWTLKDLNLSQFSIFLFSFNRVHEKFTRIHENSQKLTCHDFFSCNWIKTQILSRKKKHIEHFISGNLAHCGHNLGHNQSKLKNSS